MGSLKVNKKNIPSEADFARAKAIMRHNDRGLSEVRSQILHQFGTRGVHELFVLFSPALNSFGTYVFFDFDSQIEDAKQSGLAEEINVAMLNALEKAGRGEISDLDVTYEFDSHENVVKNYGGNYFDRLR